ncbi:hypothetical protein ACFE04_028185 [Oxalis oulophora]
MQREEDPTTLRHKMESLRLICDTEIPIHQQHMDSFTSSFHHSLQAVKAKAHQTLQNQGKLATVKAELRELETELVKVMAVKTRREAKHLAMRDSISAVKAREEDIKKTMQIQRARRDEYATLVSQQSLALETAEEKRKDNTERKRELEEAISWYNKVLGFRIEGGHGVKFIFSDINLQNPKKEYSFTIRLASHTYTLLDCDPPLNDIKELIHELNKTNGLFKFVRIMREKFLEAAATELVHQTTSTHQESSTISLSAPVFSLSTNTSESPITSNSANKIEQERQPKHSKRGKHGNDGPSFLSPGSVRKAKSPILSPASASSHRRSPRFLKLPAFKGRINQSITLCELDQVITEY